MQQMTPSAKQYGSPMIMFVHPAELTIEVSRGRSIAPTFIPGSMGLRAGSQSMEPLVSALNAIEDTRIIQSSGELSYDGTWEIQIMRKPREGHGRLSSTLNRTGSTCEPTTELRLCE